MIRACRRCLATVHSSFLVGYSVY